MESLTIKENTQPETSNVIDISANLLLCWVEDSKELATKQSNKSLKKMAIYFAGFALVGAVGFVANDAQSELDKLTREQSNVVNKLKTLGISSNPEKEKGGEVSVIQELAKAYNQANSDLVIILGHSLSQAKGQMALKTAKIESSQTGMKVTGSASVLDVRTMRVYLDNVQSAVPGTEGMMTSINTSINDQEKGLQVAFEISKLATYNFMPSMNPSTMGKDGAQDSNNDSSNEKGMN